MIAGAPDALAAEMPCTPPFARNGHAVFRAELTKEAMRARFPGFPGIAAAGKE